MVEAAEELFAEGASAIKENSKAGRSDGKPDDIGCARATSPIIVRNDIHPTPLALIVPLQPPQRWQRPRFSPWVDDKGAPFRSRCADTSTRLSCPRLLCTTSGTTGTPKLAMHSQRALYTLSRCVTQQHTQPPAREKWNATAQLATKVSDAAHAAGATGWCRSTRDVSTR